jgi:hypothetical protein
MIYKHKSSISKYLANKVDDLTNKKMYPKVASSNMSHLEAHLDVTFKIQCHLPSYGVNADFFKLLMKGFFDPYVL